MAKLHFLYSVMNAGKTTHLLQVRYNYIENGGHVLLFTSLIDDRFGVGKVRSRLGLEADATPLRKDDAIDAMMALADDFQEIKQLCHCGRKATMILKFDPNGEPVRAGPVIEIGGESRYVSVCRPHWTKGDIGPAARQLLVQAVAAAE